MAIQLNDPKTQKAALATILGLAVLYVYFLTSLFPFTYKASAAQIGELNGRYTQLSSDLTKARQTVHSMAYLEQEYELLHRKWLSAEALLPDEQEMASLLRAVTLLGDQSGIDFVLFRPLPEQAAQYYTEHPVEVQVEGGYHEIGTFLGEIANLERILVVSGLTLEDTRSPDGPPAKASFIAKTYTLGGTGVPPEQESDALAAGKDGKAGKGAKGGTAAQAVGKAKDLTKKLAKKQTGGTDHGE